MDATLAEEPFLDAPAPLLSSRYRLQQRIGKGGMGEVWRVEDLQLGREVALKVVTRPDDHRFAREIRAAARLDHPHILPLYDSGILDDGRPYFTMRLVPDARTFRSYHGTLRGRLWVLQRVCLAMALAHSRGVVHRDLKPDNILLGRFGEVLLADWGIALLAEELEEQSLLGGTPPYLSPEQANGEPQGPPADAWAMGMMLREALGEKIAVEEGFWLARRKMVPEVLEGPFAGLLRKCLSLDPLDRPVFTEIAERLSRWLEDQDRLEQAEVQLQKTLPLTILPAERWSRAEACRREAAALSVPSWAAEEQKRPSWKKEEEAEELEREALEAELEVEQGLSSALSLAPELEEAHRALARLHKERLERAENTHQWREAFRWERLLRRHDRGEFRGWLEGRAWLSLQTRPDAAEVWARPRMEADRRFYWGEVQFLGVTPLKELPMSRGSWMLELRHPQRKTVFYPIYLEREQHWDGVPPGSTEALPILLPSSLQEEDCYVPAGWARLGGDLLAPDGLAACRRWIDAFVIRTYPVRSSEYRSYLEFLLEDGQEEEARRRVPQDRLGPEEPYRPVWEIRGKKVEIRPDASGTAWEGAHPVGLVDWFDAMAYARFLSARSQKSWRLPHDLEWEKAARGVDGRFFPWGDAYEPTRARVAEGIRGQPCRVGVEEYPQDCSVYGVRGLVGNVREWCGSVYERLAPDRLCLTTEPGPEQLRMGRGGSWASAGPFCRPAGRTAALPQRRYAALGFRLARSLEEEDL